MGIVCNSSYQYASFDFHVENPLKVYHRPSNELKPVDIIGIYSVQLYVLLLQQGQG